MDRKKFSPQTNPAQAMVEFAIALPMLLMLLYGVLETGRLLFLYSTVVTASRQAVRYGAVTGTGNGEVYRYQDCDGIRAAANRAGFLGEFDTITILRDQGVTTSNPPIPVNQQTYCSGSTDTTFNPNSNDERLVVTVSEQFEPLVPNLVSFLNRTITATSARTILYSVEIVVTTQPGSFSGSGSGDLTLTILSPGTYSYAGESIAFTYRVTNSGTAGDIDISALYISTDKGISSCTGAPSALPQGASFDCTGTYATTQANMDTGSFTNTATATAGSLSDGDTETLTAALSPALTLDKVSDIDASAIVGTVITYTYTLTNSGNVTLGPPYDIDDDKIAHNDITCPASGDIAPGNSVQCTGTFQIKNSDVDAGTIVNVATGTAQTVTASPQTVTSNSDTVTVYTPALYLILSASTSSVNASGQVINYTYNLKNISASNMRPPYSVADSRVTNESCPGIPATLTPGSSVICTGSYTVTQADIDAGTTLTNSVVASAKKATGSQFHTSNTATIDITVAQTPVLNLAVSVNPTTATAPNTVVTYAYTLTNSGNVTLSPTFTITDDKASGITCTNPGVAIAPGGTKTCTGTRTISQADLDAGTVTNQASASATLGAKTVTSGLQSATVTTFVGTRLKLSITANPNPAFGSGQIITFTFTLANTGNVVLTSPYSVTAVLAGTADCSSTSSTIPVGGSVACIGFYTTQPADVGTTLVESATATAKDGSSTVTSNNATLNVPINP